MAGGGRSVRQRRDHRVAAGTSCRCRARRWSWPIGIVHGTTVVGHCLSPCVEQRAVAEHAWSADPRNTHVRQIECRDSSAIRDAIFNAPSHLLERSFRSLPFGTAAERFSSGCSVPLLRNGFNQNRNLHFFHRRCRLPIKHLFRQCSPLAIPALIAAGAMVGLSVQRHRGSSRWRGGTGTTLAASRSSASALRDYLSYPAPAAAVRVAFTRRCSVSLASVVGPAMYRLARS